MTRLRIASLLGAALPLACLAQGADRPTPGQGGDSAAGWRQCAALTADPQARLTCFDQWAQAQARAQAQAQLWQAPTATASAPAAVAESPTGAPSVAAPAPAAASLAAPSLAAAPMATPAAGNEPPGDGCRGNGYTTLSRFWELEPGTDCGALRFRGYRPMSISVTRADNVNRQPTSGNPLNNATTVRDYRNTEMRLQLSVRTKIAHDLLTRGDPHRRDSLWFGYTQQSYWQVFSPSLSRPFRNTDHEPEVMYVLPTDIALPGGWRWRYGGIGLVHQSNGQSLPLSRSWNRIYLMSGMELDDRWRVTGRIWKRLPEDAADDDNPGISNYIGRAELAVSWSPSPDDTLALTARHSLGTTARGSVRLEWLRSLGTSLAGDRTNLRLHTQLFSGYGDSLIDYNRKRTVLSVGLSLVDF